jgi:hypothetical protein
MHIFSRLSSPGFARPEGDQPYRGVGSAAAPAPNWPICAGLAPSLPHRQETNTRPLIAGPFRLWVGLRTLYSNLDVEEANEELDRTGCRRVPAAVSGTLRSRQLGQRPQDLVRAVPPD